MVVPTFLLVLGRAARASILATVASLAGVGALASCNSIFGVQPGVAWDPTGDGGVDADESVDAPDLDATPQDAVVDVDAPTCTADEDADSILDPEDGCPHVSASGSPSDSDGDGISDHCDPTGSSRQRRVVFEGWECLPSAGWNLTGWTYSGGALRVPGGGAAAFAPLAPERRTYVAAHFATSVASSAGVAITGKRGGMPAEATCIITRSIQDTYFVDSQICPLGGICVLGTDMSFAAPDGEISLLVTMDPATDTLHCQANGVTSTPAPGTGVAWMLESVTLDDFPPQAFSPNTHILILQDE